MYLDSLVTFEEILNHVMTVLNITIFQGWKLLQQKHETTIDYLPSERFWDTSFELFRDKIQNVPFKLKLFKSSFLPGEQLREEKLAELVCYQIFESLTSSSTISVETGALFAGAYRLLVKKSNLTFIIEKILPKNFVAELDRNEFEEIFESFIMNHNTMTPVSIYRMVLATACSIPCFFGERFSAKVFSVSHRRLKELLFLVS